MIRGKKIPVMKYRIILLLSLFIVFPYCFRNDNPYLTIPVIDLDRESFRQVVVDKEEGQYLGHPATVLLEDGKTILTVYPKGHGRGPIVYKRSTDGGLTWSERLPVPASWETSLEVPTIYRVIDAEGRKRLILFSGLYPARLAHSEDEDKTWSDPRPLPNELTGDRHVLKYAPDGRILAVFRDRAVNRQSPTDGDWVGWVGTWKDLVKGRKGEYGIRFKDNKHDWDCCYPGVELLPDGTFVVTTYGHWEEFKEPYIISVRFTLNELDEKLKMIKQKPAA